MLKHSVIRRYFLKHLALTNCGRKKDNRSECFLRNSVSFMINIIKDDNVKWTNNIKGKDRKIHVPATEVFYDFLKANIDRRKMIDSIE